MTGFSVAHFVSQITKADGEMITSSSTAAAEPCKENSIYSSRVQNKTLLLDNPTKSKLDGQTTSADVEDDLLDAKDVNGSVNQARKRTSKAKRGVKLTQTQKKKQLKLYDLKQGSETMNPLKYQDMMPLHHMWCQYMMEALYGMGYSGSRVANAVGEVKVDPKLKDKIHSSNLLSKIVRVDLHGCILTVVRSNRPEWIGISGIVLKETEKTFQILTSHDELKTIPKYETYFSFSLPAIGTQFTLHGSHFQVRPADRLTKKFKGANL